MNKIIKVHYKGEVLLCRNHGFKQIYKQVRLNMTKSERSFANSPSLRWNFATLSLTWNLLIMSSLWGGGRTFSKFLIYPSPANPVPEEFQNSHIGGVRIWAPPPLINYSWWVKHRVLNELFIFPNGEIFGILIFENSSKYRYSFKNVDDAEINTNINSFFKNWSFQELPCTILRLSSQHTKSAVVRTGIITRVMQR